MASKRLTDIGSATGVTSVDYIHIVNPNDTTEDPAGSSFKATLQQVVDLVKGDLSVTINSNTAKQTPTLTSTVVGGTAPYIYNWSVKQGPFNGFIISGVTNESYVNLISMSASTYMAGRYQPLNNDSLTNDGRSIGSVNVVLEVEDTNGYTTSTNHVYMCETCYKTTAPYLNPNTAPNPCEDYHQFIVIPYYGVDFMDDIRNKPTCYELDNLGCGYDPEDFGTLWRNKRDEFLSTVNSNTSSFLAGNTNTPQEITQYQFQPNPLMNKENSPVLSQYKGPLTAVNLKQGPPLNYFSGFTIPNVIISGYTVEYRITGATDNTQRLNVRTITQLNNIIGNPGDTRRVLENNTDYSWDEISKTWSNDLYTAINQQGGTNKGLNRSTYYSAKNELILAMRPFVWSNVYLPTHRIKKDIL